MKYVDEYRDNKQVQTLTDLIRRTVSRPWNLMEVCGGQTHAIARYRLEEMLPPEIKLLHGPGCPVCVTPAASIDHAIGLAFRPDVLFTTFGDMMRVPGSGEDLLHAKASGADVRMLYSPLDAVKLAEENPDKEVIFFAVGFETTAPVHLMALKEAIRKKLANFSLLTSLFTVPPAIEAILSDPGNCIQGFLTAGHVAAITGNGAYHRLADTYRTPMVVTGFEPVDLLYGIYRCLVQLERGEYRVENAYKRAVPETGNPAAQVLMDEMLEACDQEWRGIGCLPGSGLRLRPAYSRYDCRLKWPAYESAAPRPKQAETKAEKTIPTSSLIAPRSTSGETPEMPSDCIAGAIMRGHKQPADCPHFGKTCHPEHPLGAPMVSSEGVCAAYYKYR